MSTAALDTYSASHLLLLLLPIFYIPYCFLNMSVFKFSLLVGRSWIYILYGYLTCLVVVNFLIFIWEMTIHSSQMSLMGFFQNDEKLHVSLIPCMFLSSFKKNQLFIFIWEMMINLSQKSLMDYSECLEIARQSDPKIF